jgi:hypothetical protein
MKDMKLCRVGPFAVSADADEGELREGALVDLRES